VESPLGGNLADIIAGCWLWPQTLKFAILGILTTGNNSTATQQIILLPLFYCSGKFPLSFLHNLKIIIFTGFPIKPRTKAKPVKTAKTTEEVFRGRGNIPEKSTLVVGKKLN